MRKPEILAPGGSAESVYSAINAGCDAVYMGGRRFGARAFADNPDTDRLLAVMDDVHMHGKKFYLTVNTVLKEGEFGELYKYISNVYEHGVDAVIVQDMGVLGFVHREFPGLDIHASTQMSVLGKEAVRVLSGYGVTRVILARELTFSEISAIDRDSDIEIEVFVHGALCCSMSGQCLMSSLIGGRSGNRGACAQPCRKKYSFNGGKKEYFLSLKDLCALSYIPELVMSGVDSFKIEGRMKKPEYVACATHMFRKYTDIFYEYGYDGYKNVIINSMEYSEDCRALLDIYNRGGFTAGYLVCDRVTEDIFTKKRSNHSGVRVGTIRDGSIRINDKVYPHDVLEIRDEHGGIVHEHTMKDGMTAGCLTFNAGYNAGRIKDGYEVFRMRNNQLIDMLTDRYKPVIPRIKIRGTFRAVNGERMMLSLNDEITSVTVYGGICGTADKYPASENDVRNKIMVSAESIYEWDRLEIVMDGNVFLPAKELKSLRREGMKALRDASVKTFRRYGRERDGKMTCRIPDVRSNIYMIHGNDEHREPELIAECRTCEQLKVVNGSECVDTVYACIEDYDVNAMREFEKIVSETQKSIYIVLPRVSRKNTIDEFIKRCDIKRLSSDYVSIKGYVACSIEEMYFVSDELGGGGVRLRTADNIYVRNTEAYRFLSELGVSHVSLSTEMSGDEYGAFAGADADVLIYGRITAMVMLNHYDMTGTLEDDYGNAYSVIYHEKTGYTEILDYKKRDLISGAGRYGGLSKRIRFTDEKEKEVRDVLGRCEGI